MSGLFFSKAREGPAYRLWRIATTPFALMQLCPFVRAEAALRVDLATALAATGDREQAREHAHRAHTLAGELGSTRQRRRLQTLAASLR